MDSRVSGIGWFIIFLGVKKIYFNVFTHNSNPLRCEYIKIKFFLRLKK